MLCFNQGLGSCGPTRTPALSSPPRELLESIVRLGGWGVDNRERSSSSVPIPREARGGGGGVPARHAGQPSAWLDK